MWSAWIDDQLVLNPRLVQLFDERMYLLRRNIRVISTKETKHRILNVRPFLKYSGIGTRELPAQPGVESNHPGQAKILCASHQREGATHTKATGECRLLRPRRRAKIGKCSSDIRKECGHVQLLPLRPAMD